MNRATRFCVNVSADTPTGMVGRLVQITGFFDNPHTREVITGRVEAVGVVPSEPGSYAPPVFALLVACRDERIPREGSVLRTWTTADQEIRLLPEPKNAEPAAGGES